MLPFDLRFVDQEQAADAGQNHDAADCKEQDRPVRCVVLLRPHCSAEHDKDRNERHHSVDTLSFAAVRFVGAVREPCVEACVVCGRAEKRHDAIEDDDERHADRSGFCGVLRNGRKELRDPIDTQRGKDQDRDPPEDIADCNECLTLAEPVGQRADEQRCDRCGNGACLHHQSDIAL